MSDLIRREDAIAKFKKSCTSESIDKNGIKRGEIHTAMTYEGIIKIIESLPSAEPLEEFEWCHDCKEYDQEKHCCHRWTKVIRQTVEEMQMMGKIAKVIEHDASINTNDGYKYYRTEYICGNCKKKVIGGDEYCSHCGARLEWNHE